MRRYNEGGEEEDDGLVDEDEIEEDSAIAWELVMSLWGSPPPIPATEAEREAQRVEGRA